MALADDDWRTDPEHHCALLYDCWGAGGFKNSGTWNPTLNLCCPVLLREALASPTARAVSTRAECKPCQSSPFLEECSQAPGSSYRWYWQYSGSQGR